MAQYAILLISSRESILQIQVDKGAIKFVLNGSQVMCPGLTSTGARMTPGLEKEQVVAIMAEGKQHALGIGVMKMSTDEIRQVNRSLENCV